MKYTELNTEALTQAQEEIYQRLQHDVNFQSMLHAFYTLLADNYEFNENGDITNE